MNKNKNKTNKYKNIKKNITNKHRNRKHKKGGNTVNKFNLDSETEFKGRDIIKERIFAKIENQILFCERTYDKLESYKQLLIEQRIELGERYLSDNNIADADANNNLGRDIDLIENSQQTILEYYEDLRVIYNIFLNEYDTMNETNREIYFNIFKICLIKN